MFCREAKFHALCLQTLTTMGRKKYSRAFPRAMFMPGILTEALFRDGRFTQRLTHPTAGDTCRGLLSGILTMTGSSRLYLLQSRPARIAAFPLIAYLFTTTEPLQTVSLSA